MARASRRPGVIASGPVKALLFPLVVLVAALVLACGDGPDDLEPTPTPTLAPDEFGPAPSLGRNVVAISPEHGSSLPQAATRPISIRSGVCAEVNFTGTPEKALWFRMVVDEREVTEELLWIIPSEDPEEGTVCYQPDEGLEVGRHEAALSVQDPNGASAPRQIVGWSFEVTP